MTVVTALMITSDLVQLIDIWITMGRVVLLRNDVHKSDSENMPDDLLSISVVLSLFALCQKSPLIPAALRLAA